MARRSNIKDRRRFHRGEIIKALVVRILRTRRAPIAYVVKRRRLIDAAVSWRVQCPYCGKLHTHAAHEGMRQAHCSGLRLLGDNLAGQYFVQLPPDLKLAGVKAPFTDEVQNRIEQAFVAGVIQEAQGIELLYSRYR